MHKADSLVFCHLDQNWIPNFQLVDLYLFYVALLIIEVKIVLLKRLRYGSLQFILLFL